MPSEPIRFSDYHRVVQQIAARPGFLATLLIDALTQEQVDELEIQMIPPPTDVEKRRVFQTARESLILMNVAEDDPAIVGIDELLAALLELVEPPEPL